MFQPYDYIYLNVQPHDYILFKCFSHIITFYLNVPANLTFYLNDSATLLHLYFIFRLNVFVNIMCLFRDIMIISLKK